MQLNTGHRVRVWGQVRAWVRACVPVRLRAWVRACVPVRLRAWMPTWGRLAATGVGGALLAWALLNWALLSAPPSITHNPSAARADSLKAAEAEGWAANVHLTEWKTKLASVHLEIPVFSGLASLPAQQQINQLLEQRALAFGHSLQQQAEKDWSADQVQKAKAEGWFHPYEAWVTYKVTRVTAKVVSVRMDFYQYTGGAHGMTVAEGFTFATQPPAKQLALRDLFAPDANHHGPDYRTPIANEIWRQIQANPEPYFPEVSKQDIAKFDEANFYLEPGGVVVFFGLYEIAPYSSGIRQFFIPAAVLPPSPYLASDQASDQPGAA